jgi:hypothetical protein
MLFILLCKFGRKNYPVHLSHLAQFARRSQCPSLAVTSLSTHGCINPVSDCCFFGAGRAKPTVELRVPPSESAGGMVLSINRNGDRRTKADELTKLKARSTSGTRNARLRHSRQDAGSNQGSAKASGQRSPQALSNLSDNGDKTDIAVKKIPVTRGDIPCFRKIIPCLFD